MDYFDSKYARQALYGLVFGLIWISWFLYSLKKISTQESKLDLVLECEVEKLIGVELPFSIITSKDAVATPIDHKPFKVRRTAIIRAEDNRFIHAIVYEDGKGSFVKFLSELRARQILFSKPYSYKIAFGQSPDRKQLTRLMGGTDV